MPGRRALHFVLKVGNRTATAKFFREILGMKFLRHEEFEEGCKATCNGPYDGKWSKSMVGYGPEDSHFVLELTYNYGIGSYERGNDLLGIHINSSEAWENVHRHDYPHTSCDDDCMVTSPDGVKFFLSKQPVEEDPMSKVVLRSSNLQKTTDFWTGLCDMNLYTQDTNKVLLGYADNQCKLEFQDGGGPVDHAKAFGRTAFSCPRDECKLEFQDGGGPVDHAKAFGRTAFSCPRDELAGIEERLKSANQTILTPLVSLDTPGKATVEVVIPADPDGHEICFVGDEAFRELSQVDPAADDLLDKAIEEDKSDEWFAKKGRTKASA